jgi:glycosyltransferase involved in cell wall biosynthesis
MACYRYQYATGLRIVISVVIPTYGRASLVSRAIYSTLDQTLAPDEVILVDDGSLQPLERTGLPDDNRVRLVRLATNSGPAIARNAGVAGAKGEWIAFLDSDDFWYRDKLARQLAVAAAIGDKAKVVVITGWSNFRNGRISSAILPRPATRLQDFAMGCWFCPGSTAFMHRSVLDLIGPFDGSLRRLEDYDWYVRFGAQGGRLVVIDDILAGISYGHSPTLSHVLDAVSRISARYLDQQSVAYIRDPVARRQVKSYLSLVQASALWRGKVIIPAIISLLRTFAANPRLRLQNAALHRPLPVARMEEEHPLF